MINTANVKLTYRPVTKKYKFTIGSIGKMANLLYDTIHNISKKNKPYLDNNLGHAFWCSIEANTKRKREDIVSYTIVVVVIMDLAIGWAKESLCNFIGFAYPIYASLMTVEASAIGNETEWKLYWIIFVLLRFIESLVCKFSYSLPFYWLIKCIFLIWLMTPGKKGGTYIIYHQIIRRFFLNVWLLTISAASFKINPCSENVMFSVKSGTRSKTIELKSNQQGIISLDSFEDDDYAFDAYSTPTEPSLSLHQFRIKKFNGAINTHAIDLQATILHATFKRQNVEFSEADVSGEFTDTKGRTYRLKGRTNNEGVFTIVLPEGTIKNFMAKNREYTVPKTGNVPIPAPVYTPPDVQRPPKYITIETESLSFSSSIKPTNMNARVVILGDVSGSMERGIRMEILKRSYLEICQKAQKNGWKVSLASWDHEISWCTNKWIESHQTEAVKEWIDSRLPNGENDMQNAITDCMKRFPDATDVYVMCDGDIDPFTLDDGENSWRMCRNKYPGTKFHFIALGKDASCEPMEVMATIGGGEFTHAT